MIRLQPHTTKTEMLSKTGRNVIKMNKFDLFQICTNIICTQNCHFQNTHAPSGCVSLGVGVSMWCVAIGIFVKWKEIPMKIPTYVYRTIMVLRLKSKECYSSSYNIYIGLCGCYMKHSNEFNTLKGKFGEVQRNNDIFTPSQEIYA